MESRGYAQYTYLEGSENEMQKKRRLFKIQASNLVSKPM